MDLPAKTPPRFASLHYVVSVELNVKIDVELLMRRRSHSIQSIVQLSIFRIVNDDSSHVVMVRPVTFVKKGMQKAGTHSDSLLVLI